MAKQENIASYQLESLEQRVLLSGDGLLPAAALAPQIDDSLFTGIQENFDGSLETSSITSGSDLFAGMESQNEVVLGKVEELVADDSAEAVSEVQTVQETESVEVAAPTPAVEAVISAVGTNEGENFADQLVETLVSAQGPPSQRFGLQSVSENTSQMQQDDESDAGEVFASTESTQNADGQEVIAVSEGETLGGNWVGNYAVENNGTVSPGHSPGFLDVAAFNQGAGGTLQIEIGGKMPGTGYDQVRVSGLAQLDGKLDIDLINGFTPQVGDTFDIMTYGSVSGEFAAGTGLFGFGDGNLYFEVVQANGKIQLVVKEVSGALAAITPASGTAADAVGQILNHEYFDVATIEFDGTLQISQFVFVSGSFALSVGTKTVTMEDGATKNTFAFMGGAADVYVFVGIGGPYWVDSDNDGDIDANDTPEADGAVGIALENVDVGFAMFKPVSLIDFADYLALKVTADSAQIVGMDGILDLELHDIEVGVNLVDDPFDTPLTPADGVDFSAMAGGGLNVPTGGDPVTLDFSAPILQVFVGDALLQVGSFIFVRGSFAFTKGETYDVTLDDGDTTEVETMTIGASNVHVFAGIGGPYWVDSDNDGDIDANDTPESDGAYGIILEDVDVGMVFMQETKLLLPASYFALKV
ncbi:MAG TPA: LEPR-XLL domain-containing protein, partial [Verrucomicrobiae bacterium]